MTPSAPEKRLLSDLSGRCRAQHQRAAGSSSHRRAEGDSEGSGGGGAGRHHGRCVGGRRCWACVAQHFIRRQKKALSIDQACEQAWGHPGVRAREDPSKAAASRAGGSRMHARSSSAGPAPRGLLSKTKGAQLAHSLSDPKTLFARCDP
jgi:hypothetical protein